MASPTDGAGPRRSSRASGYSKRSVYLPDDVWFQSRNAAWACHTVDEWPQTHSEFIAAAVRLFTRVAEEELNGGDAFDEAPDRLPKGPSPAGASRLRSILREQWAAERSTGAEA